MASAIPQSRAAQSHLEREHPPSRQGASSTKECRQAWPQTHIIFASGARLANHPGIQGTAVLPCPGAGLICLCARGLSMPATRDEQRWRSTTILSVRKGGKVVIAGDGQVTM